MMGTPKSYKENTFMITKKIFLYCCASNNSCMQKIFLMKVIFIQGAFKNIQALLWKI